MTNIIANIFYVIVGLSWTIYFVKLSKMLFGNEIEIEILATICGSSLGVLICWTIMYLTIKIKEKDHKKNV